MSAAFQAIDNGGHAAASGVPLTSSGPCESTGRAFARLVVRPRVRRQALAVRQDV